MWRKGKNKIRRKRWNVGWEDSGEENMKAKNEIRAKGDKREREKEGGRKGNDKGKEKDNGRDRM